MADAAKKAKILQSAQKLVQKGQYDKAIKELLVLVKEEPKDVRIWLKIGDLHAKRGAAAEAIETYLKVAEFYSEQGFHLKAIAVYRQILSIDPSRIEFNVKLAEIYAHLALVRESFDQYELVANAYLRAGRTADAILVLQRMVAVDAENIPNRIKLAEMLSREGRKDEAADEFAGAAARLEAAGRLDDFVKVAERLVYHRAEDTVTLKRLAYIYIERRDPKRALAKLQQAFKVAPNDAETLGFLAQAFRGIGQIPKTIQVLKELCNLLDREGRRSDRDEVWRQILELDPRDADAQRALGLAQGAPGSAGTAPAGARLPQAAGTPSPAPAPSGARGSWSRGSGAATAPRGGGGMRGADFEIEDDDAHESGGARTVHDESAEPELLGEAEEAEEIEASAEMMLDDELIEELEEESDESGAVARAAEEAFEEARRKPELGRSAPPPAAAAALFGRGAEPSAAPAARAPAAAPAASGAGENVELSKMLQETDIYIKYGLHSKAIEHVKRVLALDAGHLGALQRLGDLYIGNGSYEDAVKVLLKLSEAHNGRGDRDAAVAVLERAVEIKPDEREVRSRLSALGRPGRGAEEDTPIEDLLGGDDEDERTPVGEVMFSDESDGLAPETLFDDFGDREVPELLAGTGPGGEPRGGRSAPPRYGEEGGRSLLEDFPDMPVGDDAIEDTRSSRKERALDRDSEELDADHGSGPLLGAGLVPSVPSGTRPPSRTGSGRVPRADPDSSRAAGPASGASAEAEIADALEEADFFVAQGLLDEARAIVDDTRERYPTDKRLLGKQIELADLLVERTADGGGKTPVPVAPPPRPSRPIPRSAAAPPPPADRTSETNLLPAGDVSSEVDQSIEAAQEHASDRTQEQQAHYTPPTGRAARRDSDVSEALRRTSHDQVKGDAPTRFDLAIAYKEMGLLDAAVTELKAVLETGYKVVDCWQLIGLCLVEKGDFPRAEAAFKSGLAVEGIGDTERIGLFYELGSAFEAQNDLREALYYFESVDRKDPRFRGVHSRVAALRARAASAPAATPGPSTRAAESGASPLPLSTPGAGDEEEFELAAYPAGDDGERYH